MSPHDLLAIPDEKIDAALAVAMEWRREGNCWHHRKQSSAPPAYCSEDSPRRLLGEAISNIPAEKEVEFEKAAFALMTARLVFLRLCSVPARLLARAALYVLDPAAAERLIAEVKG